MAIFMPAFGAAVVLVRPGRMSATGNSTLLGQKICIEGDESQLMVPGCMYTSGPYVIPGVGTLKIDSLGPDQTAKKTKSGRKAIIVKGTTFNAKFEVQTPAQQPSPPGPPVPDSSAQYSGKGHFQTMNVKWKVS